MEKVSIIYTHWAMNELRSKLMRESMESLLRTAPDAEIIVCDNGGSYEDSEYLMRLCHEGKIASYTRYRQNQHFYYARNDALRRASGKYIAVSDNDILFTTDWLKDCLDWLARTPGKYMATPIKADWMNGIRPDRWKGELNGWLLNQRAGSNIWVMRREDYEAIGDFDAVAVAGSKYVDRYVRMGYLMGVMPVPKAFDMGFRHGYNHQERGTLDKQLL